MAEEEYQAELTKFHMQTHLIDLIRNLDADELEGISSSSKRRIDLAVAQLQADEYIRSDDNSNVLGLRSQEINLTNGEKSTVKNRIIGTELPLSIQPQLEFAKDIDEKLFDPKSIADKLEQLEQRRKRLETDIVESRLELCEKLDKCMELKYGPKQECVAQLLHENAELEYMKALACAEVPTKYVMNQTSHTEKALVVMNRVLADLVAEKSKNDLSESK